MNTIRYQALEWNLSQEDVLAALTNVRAKVRKLFEQGNRDANPKPKPPRTDDSDE